jgi:hypothetical protein
MPTHFLSFLRKVRDHFLEIVHGDWGRASIHWTPSRILTVLVLLTLTGVFSTIDASRIRPVNLEEMTTRADRIFRGRCTGVRIARDPETGQMVTHVTFVVDRAVKGKVRGNLKIKLLGEQDFSRAPRRGIKGLPRFRQGEEVILFLYGDSRSGLTSPVGFGQGKFTLIKNKIGEPKATNAFANENLFRGLSPAAKRDLGDQVSRWKGRREIPPDVLLEMVDALSRSASPPSVGQ